MGGCWWLVVVDNIQLGDRYFDVSPDAVVVLGALLVVPAIVDNAAVVDEVDIMIAGQAVAL
jgi:hypothetical protein